MAKPVLKFSKIHNQQIYNPLILTQIMKTRLHISPISRENYFILAERLPNESLKDYLISNFFQPILYRLFKTDI